MSARPAAGGGRWVDVEPARLPRWLAGFEDRHGPATITPPAVTAPRLRLVAADGATAELSAPPGVPVPASLDELVAQAQRPRRLGLLLARQSAVAMGVAEGERLLVSKVDSSYVQGRTAAGGWSQHRFARRRENQAKAAAGGAADTEVRMLLPEVGGLAAVVAGGDRRAVEAILADPRLAPVRALRAERFLDVPEPRLAVLERAIGLARAVRILVRDAVD
jgi:Actinobacteria/chloroflexi VLRF1 release factor